MCKKKKRSGAAGRWQNRAVIIAARKQQTPII